LHSTLELYPLSNVMATLNFFSRILYYGRRMILFDYDSLDIKVVNYQVYYCWRYHLYDQLEASRNMA
jgi:hypothetical protein